MTERFITKFAILYCLVFTFCFTTNAQNQTVAQTDAKVQTNEAEAKTDETQTRIQQLEAQIQAMQGQIDVLKSLINQGLKPAPEKSETKAAETVAAAPENKTTETVKIETKQPQQQKQLGVDIGSARLTPYGTIFFNAFTNTGGTNNSDVPLFAVPTGAGNTSASVRQTRLGLRLEGARVGNARLGAVIEADFFGGIPNIGIGENFGVVRLRLANARIDWEKTSVTIGQDWMPFAPVNPTSLAAAAIPQMAAAGNNWARIPQIKIERKIGENFTWQGAVLAPQTGDYQTASSFFLQPTSGAASRIPFFQSRLAMTGRNFLGSGKAATAGISGHYGRSRVLTGAGGSVRNDLDSTGVAADWNLPLHARVVLTGEAFFGRNLGGFQAGIFQSYNTDFAYLQGNTLVAGGVRAIGTRGGWMQLGFTPDAFQDRLTLYGSVGIDDPRDADLFSTNRRDFRSQNFVYAFDAIYKFTPQFSIGAEFRRLETLYLFSGRREASHINLGASYSF